MRSRWERWHKRGEHAMIDQFRPYLVSALVAAGWQVIHRTQAGQDI